MAIVWIYGQKNYTQPQKGSRFLKLVFSRYGVVLFIALLCVFAFVEEGLWDVAVWKEHGSVFGLSGFAGLQLNYAVLSKVNYSWIIS